MTRGRLLWRLNGDEERERGSGHVGFTGGDAGRFVEGA